MGPVELIGAALAGGAIKQLADYALASRRARAEEKAREAEQDVTLQQHVAKYSAELFEHYNTELKEQARTHSEELDALAKKHAKDIEASAELLRVQTSRADAAELESERERSRRREAERERDHERDLRVAAEHARDEAVAAVRDLSDNLRLALDDIAELKRERRPSGEMRAVKPE